MEAKIEKDDTAAPTREDDVTTFTRASVASGEPVSFKMLSKSRLIRRDELIQCGTINPDTIYISMRSSRHLRKANTKKYQWRG